MTIAACYLSADGVVFGADSTTTVNVYGLGPGASGGEHHFNYAQKVFQVGEDSTLGMTMWGLGNFPGSSYRTLIAQFADMLVGQGPQSMEEAARLWSEFFWAAYSNAYAEALRRARDLSALPTLTNPQRAELEYLTQSYSGGFSIGGYLINNREPAAFEILYNPGLVAPPTPAPLAIGSTRFWGCPNLIERLLFCLDENLFASIASSPHWTGKPEDLADLMRPYCLGQPFDLPIREAIDWVYSSIYTTIKTMKFSHLAPVCGGPIEVAAITTDRRFRWVRHKSFDSAIGDGGLF